MLSTAAQPAQDALDASVQKSYPGAAMYAVPLLRRGEHTLRELRLIPVDTPEPHFLFVTCGLSDLAEQSTDDAAPSGFGCELTLRVARESLAVDDDGQFDIPAWCAPLLEFLACYVRKRRFGPGETFDLKNPVVEGSRLSAVLFVRDCVLAGPLDTANGAVELLQCVFLTPDELEAVDAWRGVSFAKLMATYDPLLVAHAGRESMLVSPEFRSRCEDGAAREGSSDMPVGLPMVWTRHQRSPGRDGVEVELGPETARAIATGIRRRFVRQQSFMLIGLAGGPASPQGLVFAPRTTNSWAIHPVKDGSDGLGILVTTAFAERLCADLGQGRAGVLEWAELPDLTIRIVPKRAS